MATKLRTKQGRLEAKPSLLVKLRRMKMEIKTNIQRRKAARISEDLGVGPKVCPSIAFELLHLKKKNRVLAKEYWRAAKKTIERLGADCFENQRTREDATKQVLAAAREQVYSLLGIKLNPVSDHVKKKLGVGELNESRVLFRFLVYGGLKEQVLQMAGIQNPDDIEVDRAFAGVEIYCLTVTEADKKTRVFVDETGVEPDLLAADLVREPGIIVPEMVEVPYNLADGRMSSYGLIQDIADAKGVKRAVSLRALARDERMAKLVKENFDQFIELLGYVFEKCRILGIQDRHDRNLFVIEKTDGSLAIGLIDLDIVACYPIQARYQDAFAGQLHRIMDSLYFDTRFGELVRSDPGRLGQERKKEDWANARIEMKAMAERILKIFVKGAERARAFYMEQENQDRVWEMFEKHHGRPVGWGCDEDRFQALLQKKAILLETGGEEMERGYINGRLQKLIRSEPHRGRIILNSSDAWNHGFKAQLRQEKKEDKMDIEGGFWGKTFYFWSLALPHWVPKRSIVSNDLGIASTIAY